MRKPSKGSIASAIAMPSLEDIQPPEGGQHSFLAALYRTYKNDLVRYLSFRFGIGPSEPEEVAQAAFEKLATSPNIANLENPRSYLYTIACNIAIDQQRRSTVRNAIHRDMVARANSASVLEPSPEEILLAKERFALFERALRAMPAMRRRIFLMVRVEGTSLREVARRFGISEGAAHKHISRAMKDCAAVFEQSERRK